MSWKHFVKLLAGKGRRRLSFICLICDNALFVFLYCEFSSLSAAFSLIFMKFAKISCKKNSSRFQFDDFNHVRNYWSKISSLSPGDVFYFARVLNKNTILPSSSSMCDGEGVEMKLIWKRTFFQLRMPFIAGVHLWIFDVSSIRFTILCGSYKMLKFMSQGGSSVNFWM